MGSNYYRGAYLRTLLDTKGIVHGVQGVIPDGAHDWSTADRHMAVTLPLHWAALRAPDRVLPSAQMNAAPAHADRRAARLMP